LSKSDPTRPLIGLTAYARDDANRFYLPAVYCECVVRAGGVPVLLPPVDVDVSLWLTRLDGLILTGGGDVDPASYGGKVHPAGYGMDRQRDANELAIVRHALEVDLPTLAICRGIQVLNVALGGTLIVHIPDVVGKTVLHRLPPRAPTPHPVTISPESRLAQILGCTECTSVSWHHQAIADPGRGLNVVAHAPDGVIEAVEMAGHPRLIAVQWHPELSAATDPIQQRLFDQFVLLVARPQSQ
jgi:putative glutamine amidotransferase